MTEENDLKQLEESYEIERKVIGVMGDAYQIFGEDAIPFELIDTLANYIKTVRVRYDSEFRKALGDGYYK